MRLISFYCFFLFFCFKHRVKIYVFINSDTKSLWEIPLQKKSGISKFSSRCGQQGATWGRPDGYRVPDNMRVEGGKKRGGGFFILLTESQIKLTRRKSVKLWLIMKRLRSWPVASFFFFFAHTLLPVFLFYKVCVQRDFLCASSTICPAKGKICL